MPSTMRNVSTFAEVKTKAPARVLDTKEAATETREEPKKEVESKPVFELSTKDTKSRLLEVAENLGIEIDKKMSKQKILNTLLDSEFVSMKPTASSLKASKKK